jgi:hypothetical protein
MRTILVAGQKACAPHTLRAAARRAFSQAAVVVQRQFRLPAKMPKCQPALTRAYLWPRFSGLHGFLRTGRNDVGAPE